MPGVLRHFLRMPGRIAAIAGVTFTQLVRMRLFMALAAFAVGFLALQFLPYQQNLGVEFAGVGQLQLIQDVATGCMRLFGMLFCVAATALLIPRDSEDRILYTILSKPVPRFDYLAGKALGVLTVLALMLLLLGIREPGITAELQAQLAAAGYSEQDMQPYLQQVRTVGNSLYTQVSIFAMFLGLAVLTTFTLLISCVTSGTIVSIVFALGAYFIGMFQAQLFNSIYAAVNQTGVNATMQCLQQIFALVVPDFSLFSLTDELGDGNPLEFGLIGSLAAVALGYMLLHLLTAAWVILRKEF